MKVNNISFQSLVTIKKDMKELNPIIDNMTDVCLEKEREEMKNQKSQNLSTDCQHSRSKGTGKKKTPGPYLTLSTINSSNSKVCHVYHINKINLLNEKKEPKHKDPDGKVVKCGEKYSLMETYRYFSILFNNITNICFDATTSGNNIMKWFIHALHPYANLSLDLWHLYKKAQKIWNEWKAGTIKIPKLIVTEIEAQCTKKFLETKKNSNEVKSQIKFDIDEGIKYCVKCGFKNIISKIKCVNCDDEKSFVIQIHETEEKEIEIYQLGSNLRNIEFDKFKKHFNYSQKNNYENNEGEKITKNKKLNTINFDYNNNKKDINKQYDLLCGFLNYQDSKINEKNIEKDEKMYEEFINSLIENNKLEFKESFLDIDINNINNKDDISEEEMKKLLGILFINFIEKLGFGENINITERFKSLEETNVDLYNHFLYGLYFDKSLDKSKKVNKNENEKNILNNYNNPFFTKYDEDEYFDDDFVEEKQYITRNIKKRKLEYENIKENEEIFYNKMEEFKNLLKEIIEFENNGDKKENIYNFIKNEYLIENKIEIPDTIIFNINKKESDKEIFSELKFYIENFIRDNTNKYNIIKKINNKENESQEYFDNNETPIDNSFTFDSQTLSQNSYKEKILDKIDNESLENEYGIEYDFDEEDSKYDIFKNFEINDYKIFEDYLSEYFPKEKLKNYMVEEIRTSENEGNFFFIIRVT
jgi:hypothetical protein